MKEKIFKSEIAPDIAELKNKLVNQKNSPSACCGVRGATDVCDI